MESELGKGRAQEVGHCPWSGVGSRGQGEADSLRVAPARSCGRHCEMARCHWAI